MNAPNNKPIVGTDEGYATVTVPVNAGDNLTEPLKVVTSVRAPLNRKCWIRALGNVSGPGGDGSLTFMLKVNGSLIYPYDGSQNQWGDPALLQDLPQWIEIPAGSLVEVLCANSSTTTSYTATARIWTAYQNV